MAYFMINGNDYSNYVKELKVSRSATYRSQVNAAGNTVVDNTIPKLTIEVGVIPLSDEAMAQLLEDVYQFEAYVSFREPRSNVLKENVHCIVPQSKVEYYTIQVGKVLYKAFNLTFQEL